MSEDLQGVFLGVALWTGEVVNQTICTSRQLKFQIFKNNKSKIGMNMTANKFYCITNQIGLDMLNMNFFHFKKLGKIQFLKFCKT